MNLINDIVEKINLLNDFGKIGLFQELFDKKIINIDEVVSQYAKFKQEEVDKINSELMTTYANMLGDEESRINFLKKRNII